MSTGPAIGTRIDVPVFPLPKLVLFPGTTLPLHIFEPRYQDMLADCLVGKERLIAVTQLKPGWESTYEGRPPIYATAGIGKLVRHTHNADGTYEILLEAVARVHLEELAPEGLRYRRASATLLTELVPKDGVDADDIAALLRLSTRISAVVKRALPGFSLQASASDSPALLTDRIADHAGARPECTTRSARNTRRRRTRARAYQPPCPTAHGSLLGREHRHQDVALSEPEWL